MSDRLAVFNHGRVEQVGTPSEVYENPRNAFVAGFVGTSNVMSGAVAERIMGSPVALHRPAREDQRSTSLPRQSRRIGPAVEGTIAEAVYLGMYTRYRVDVGGAVIEVAAQNTAADHSDAQRQIGRSVKLTWMKSSCRPLEESPREGEPDERAPVSDRCREQHPRGGNHRMRSRKLILLITAIALLATACTDSGGEEGADLPTEIGEGEGSVVIVSWAGYIERGDTDANYDWVTSFEEETGCMVENKIAGTSDEMVALMTGSEEYDLVTASGDSSLRLIAGGAVQEINIDLIESWDTIDPRLQDAEWHTIDDKHYGTPYSSGFNVLGYNTEVFGDTPPDLVERGVRGDRTCPTASRMWDGSRPTTARSTSPMPPST